MVLVGSLVSYRNPSTQRFIGLLPEPLFPLLFLILSIMFSIKIVRMLAFMTISPRILFMPLSMDLMRQPSIELEHDSVLDEEFAQAVEEILCGAGIGLDTEMQCLIQTTVSLQEQLKESQAALLLEQMLEIGAYMDSKPKSDEATEDTDFEVSDISFEELLAQEKKDSFWQKKVKPRSGSD